MLNQLTISAVVFSEPVVRYSQDGLYKIHEFMADVAPTQADGVYTRVSFRSIAGKDSDRASLIETLKMDDVILVQGSLHINQMEVDGGKRNVPQVQVDQVYVLQAAANVPENQEIDDNFRINKFIITGRPGSDPEVKYFEGGSIVANLSIACDRPTKGQTDWIPVAIWGQTAEVAANYVRKGGLIALTGQLKFEHWSDKVTGEPRMKSVLNTGSFMGPQALRLLGSGNARADENNTQGYTQSSGQSSSQPTETQTSRRGRATANGNGVGNGATTQPVGQPVATRAQPVPALATANYDDIPF